MELLNQNGATSPREKSANPTESGPTGEHAAAVGEYRLFEPLLEGIVIVDDAWCIRYLNPATARILGKPRSLLLQSVLWTSLPELLETEWERHLRAASETGEPRDISGFFPSARIWVQGRIEPTDEGLCLYLRDLNTGNPLSCVVDNIEEASVLLDSAGHYVYANHQAALMAGCSREELIGVNAWERYPRARASALFQAVHRAREKQQAVYLEMKSPTLGRDMALSVYPQGEFVAVMARDITERKRAERALQDSEEWFRLATSAGAVGVWDWDITANRVSWSDSIYEIHGLERGQFDGTVEAFDSLIHPDDRTMVRDAIQGTLKEGKSYELEFRSVRPDGAIIWIYTKAKVIRDADGQPVRMLGGMVDITRRKQAESALLYRGQQFETLLNNAPLSIYMLDTEFRVREANPVVRTATANLPGGVVGRDFDEISHLLWEKGFADHIVQTFRNTLETGRSFAANEMEAFGADGQSIGYFDWRVDRITLPDGRFGVVCYARDITSQVKARQAVEESEQLFRTFGEAIPFHLWMTDAVGRPIYQNPSWHAYTGMTHDQFATFGWESLHRAEDLPRMREIWEEAFRTGTALEVEIPLRRYDGAFRWFACRTLPVRDSRGQIIKWVGTHLDIDEKKRAEQSLRESEQRFHEIANQLSLITDSAPVYLAKCDAQTRFQFVNRPYAARFGLTPDDCEGKTIREIVGEVAYERLRPYVEQTLQGRPTRFDIDIPYEGIGVRFMHCSYVPDIDAEGRVIGLVAAISDITDRHHIEQALEERNREVEALNQRLLRAMTETHHRVKNNLQLISAMIDLQRMSGAESVYASEFAHLSNNVRALAVIHDILTQEAKAGNDQETMSARAVLRRLLQAVELASPGRPLVARIDDVRLSAKKTTTLALVTNELIANGIKHGRGPIELHLSVEGEWARLIAEDDGPGFPADFNPSSAANTGLDLIESLVGWDLRGKIVYGNRPTGGAQVTVTFPIL